MLINKRYFGSKILVVDDEQLSLDAIQTVLSMLHYSVDISADGPQALRLVSENDYDTIILDIGMPAMDGFELFAKIREICLEVPILFLTGDKTLPNAIRALALGAYDFILKPIDCLEIFDRSIRRAVDHRQHARLRAAYQEQLETELQEKTSLLDAHAINLENSTVAIISSLQVALEKKDVMTAGHTLRVTELAAKIGTFLSCSAQELKILVRSAQLHDLGKLVIDLSCIQKESGLTDSEWEIIRRHPEVGADILEPLGFLADESNIVRHHHEKLDGSGYPSGLKRDEIPFLTRIITVADSFDAMISRRSYKSSRSAYEAAIELKRCTGSHFDGDVVSALLVILKREGLLTEIN